MSISLGRMTAGILVVLIVLLTGAVQSSAEIYRWVDENGVTHFSDRKPVGKDAGKEETVDPSKSGTVSVIEGGKHNPSPTQYIKELFTSDEKKVMNRSSNVIIYTTPT